LEDTLLQVHDFEKMTGGDVEILQKGIMVKFKIDFWQW